MIDYPYRDLYYEDSIHKKMSIIAEDGTEITNTDIYMEEMTINESLCSESNLTYGCCESGSVYFKIANRFSPLFGQKITVSQTIDGHTDNPFQFGIYTVQSDKPTADRIYREITAYDAMYDIINADGIDVAEWYNEILPENDSTVTLKEFRQSFISHFGLEEESTSLVNDNMIVEKTISTSSLSGKRVINAICEINGVFGHITREGKFKYIQLEKIEEDTAFTIPLNRSSDYEDYETAVIDCLQIRESEDDSGVVYGIGDNRYIIQGNFLLYGKTTSELVEIAENLYPIIKDISFRPSSITTSGNPCLEVGDIVHLSTKHQEIYTYILSRSLKGIQGATDTYDSKGEETYVDNGGSLSEQIEQIKSRTSELAEDVATAVGEVENINVQVQELYADYAEVINLQAEVAEIRTLFANYISVDVFDATIANIESAIIDEATIRSLIVSYGYITEADIETLRATVATINEAYIDYAEVETIIAGYGFLTEADIESLRAQVAIISEAYITYAEVTELLAGYASIADLNAIVGNITALTSDVANITSLLSGEVGTGSLQSIVLTTDNAVIDDALIYNIIAANANIGSLLAGIIYTDYITIMSENGGIVIAGTTIQISDEDGTVRMQIGQDADGNFTFIIYDETGTGIMIDSEGIHESAVPDGLIVDSMVSDDAAIQGSKLDIASVAECLTADGTLIVQGSQVTINGETLDTWYAEIERQLEGLEGLTFDGLVNLTEYFALGDSYEDPPLDPDGTVTPAQVGTAIVGTSLVDVTQWSDVWSTDRKVAGEGQYLWVVWLAEYNDGSYAWSTPVCLTDGYSREHMTVLQTELSVVQGQIAAKVWQTDIDTAYTALYGDITTLTDQYAAISISLGDIEISVGNLETVEADHYLEMSTQIANISVTLDAIDLSLSSINQSISGLETSAITDSKTEYYLSTSSSELTGGTWSEDYPGWTDGTYIWVRTTITMGTGDSRTTTTTDPICLTGNSGKDGTDGTNGTDGVGVANITAYYSVSGSATWCQPHGDDGRLAIVGSAVVGTAVADNTGVWTTEMPTVDITEYLWVCLLVEYTNGETAWTDAWCLTDDSTRTVVSQISAQFADVLIQLDEIDLYVYSLETTVMEDYTELSERYAAISITLDGITETVSALDETVTGDILILTERVAGIEINVDSVTTRVSSVESEVANVSNAAAQAEAAARAAELLASGAIVKATPYFAESGSPDWYPSHTDDGTLALVGSAVVGNAKADNSGTWALEQPAGGEGIYIWCAYLYEYADGTEEWQEPFWIDDGSVKEDIGNLRKQYAEIVVEIGNISMTVADTEGAIASLQLGIAETQEDIISYINASADMIILTGDRIEITSDNFILTADGDITAKSGRIGGWYIGDNSLYNGTSSLTSTVNGMYLGTDGIRNYNNGSYLNITDAAIKNGDSDKNYCSIRAGTMRLYRDDTETGRFAAYEWSNNANYPGIYLAASIDAKFISFSYGEDGSYSAAYIINFGLDSSYTGGYSDRHIFYDNARFTGSLAVNGTLNVGLTVNSEAIVRVGNSSYSYDNSVRVYNSLGSVYLSTSTDGYFGLYDGNESGWFCYWHPENERYTLGNTNLENRIVGSKITSNVSIEVSSDRTLKCDFMELNEQHNALFDALNPCMYHLKSNPDKYHMGFVAQEVEQAVENAGISLDDFALTSHFKDDDGNEIGGIVYDEIIPLLVYEIQQLKSQIAELQANA